MILFQKQTPNSCMQGGGEKEKSNAEKAHPRPAACLGVTLLAGSPLIYTE